MARGSVKARPLKDGTVRYRVKWEDRAPDGSRRHHSATTRTKKEADALLAEKLAEVERGTYVEPSKEPLAGYLARWLEAMGPSWGEATAHSYASVVRARLVPRLGAVPLSRLTEPMIQGCYAAMIGAGYAASTVKTTHVVLHSALGEAVRWRLLARNPADNLTLPRVEAPAPAAWDAAEAGAFLSSAAGDPLAALYRLALDSGMRLGECLALGWADVDLGDGVVAVRRTLTVDVVGRLVVGMGPKTRSSRRSVPIGAATVAALRAHRARQAERRLAAAAWHDRGLVFDRGDGERLRPDAAQGAFGRAVRGAGVRSITFHGLRHTCATLLLAAGVHPKVVQERLGHKSIAMTMDLYRHAAPTMQRDAAAVLDGVLGEKARPRRGHGSG